MQLRKINNNYFNKKFNAYNVFEINVEIELINEVEKYYYNIKKDLKNNKNFYTASPSWTSDIKWISVNNIKTYNYFLKFFNNINIDIVKKKNFILTLLILIIMGSQ